MSTPNYEPGQRLRTIRLYGKLGARFGRVHTLAVASAAEACRALSVLLPGFEQFMFEAKDKGIVFAVFHGKRNISHEEFGDPPGRNEIRIAPVIQGSKRAGTLQTALGVALIVAASFFGGPAGGSGAASLFGGGVWGVVGTIGISMAIGGVAQMITNTANGLSTSDSADNRASYSFSGPVNTQAQGNPVPLGYGRMIVGSAVGSAGIYAEDQA
ncbi:tail assembly protein [Pseudomonas eucalypticola]|uniref:Tail assembly protein n=1 Tax=Pseudomonas eucalypticola TaxID=2599595 RepID=A0A7D5D8Y6_9PSED|nr:tail assembly protein [Pseudomonas eucalypticola]QKZ05818.1 tail assembly protein [Pseudomonas eucalypticola]